MKKVFFFAATALLFAACSNDEVNAPEAVQAPQAVAFDTYVPAATRAGAAGVMTTTTLQTTGFGVFAQQGAAYASDADPNANFMYNQKVEIENSAWTYSPLKYWPNETGNDAGASNTATSTDVEKLSFFAYAPYVSAASGSTGITGMSAKDATTDPTITYTVATKPSESVDLLWGVAPTGGLSYTNVANGTTTVTEGLPLIDLLKPAKEQKIKFLFKHALARLGMTVVAAVDQIPAGGTLGTGTKIYVNSVKITDAAATATIPSSATLNLNNTTAGVALWTNPVTTSAFTCTIDNSNELNEDLQGTAAAQTKAGVTTSETGVLADGKYLMLIPTPGTDATLEVEIDYTVITNDANLSAGYAETNNVIKKTVTLTSGGTAGFTNNKAYNLKLILGMTSVKLDAEVAEWEIAGSTEVDLPKNK